jgi:hypothetical protein
VDELPSMALSSSERRRAAVKPAIRSALSVAFKDGEMQAYCRLPATVIVLGGK